jgi:hypothetical protein
METGSHRERLGSEIIQAEVDTGNPYILGIANFNILIRQSFVTWGQLTSQRPPLMANLGLMWQFMLWRRGSMNWRRQSLIYWCVCVGGASRESARFRQHLVDARRKREETWD